METIFAYLRTATTDPPTEVAYTQDLTTALAAAAALAAVLFVIYLVIRATYLIIRLFTAMAGHLTMAMVAAFVLIGWLNR